MGGPSRNRDPALTSKKQDATDPVEGEEQMEKTAATRFPSSQAQKAEAVVRTIQEPFREWRWWNSWNYKANDCDCETSNGL
jgi:hypothetical protein